MREAFLVSKDPQKEPIGKLITTAVFLVASIWASLCLFGYGIGTALLLAWLSSGVLIPAVMLLSMKWPKIVGSRKVFMNRDGIRQAVRTDRQ